MDSARSETVDANHKASEKSPRRRVSLFVARRGRAAFLGTLLAVCFVFCYADVFRTLWQQWNTNEANSHGFLIPWISLYIAWMRRERLAELRLAPVWWAGCALVLGGLGLLLIGRLVGVVGLEEVSTVITLWGLTVLVLGWRGLRELWFPVAYLLFMMPIWDLATEPMYYPLQQFAATLGAGILTLVGIPVFQDGTFLHLPNTSVEVAYACSGINFLMAVLAIGTLLAYVMVDGLARRVVLVLGAVIVALLANPVRVAVITYLLHTGAMSPGQGHIMQGLVVSLAAYAVLFLCARWLAVPRPVRGQIGLSARRGGDSGATVGRGPAWPLIVGCVLLATAGTSRSRDLAGQPLGALKLRALPPRVGDWTADPSYDATGPEGWTVQADEFWRRYRNAVGDSIQVYVGRFGHLTPERPGMEYLTDGLWSIEAIVLELPTTRTIAANSALVLGRGRRTPIIYWYRLGTMTTGSRTLAKLFGVWGVLTRTGAGPIVIALYGGDVERDRQAAVRKISSFGRELATYFDSGRDP